MNKLLIVDDMAQSRFFLFKLFDSHGFTVFLAEDGMTAIEQFNRHRPEFVLSDIHMPNMSGFALAWHLHHRHNQSVTLITSSDIEYEAVDADGVDEIIHKTDIAGNLPELISRLLSRLLARQLASRASTALTL
ncbi:response regulator [Thalassomonas actiniarum]|uniref:Response regulator n=1 Tax=Thalassomonas actiniarum TaxID=485447 RepID=A0AAE9YTD3_9GAMM|nr:response regulator [Thalassomonas actiniarum]WDE00756.1 response regulator [Thalassomonas actiniarum]